MENVPVHESTPWPGAGKVSGNLFEDRNWLLSPNYLDYENKNVTGITSPRPPIKEEEPKVNEQLTEKCGWGPDCPFYKNREKEDDKCQQQQKMSPQHKIAEAPSKTTKNSECTN